MGKLQFWCETSKYSPTAAIFRLLRTLSTKFMIGVPILILFFSCSLVKVSPPPFLVSCHTSHTAVKRGFSESLALIIISICLSLHGFNWFGLCKLLGYTYIRWALILGVCLFGERKAYIYLGCLENSCVLAKYKLNRSGKCVLDVQFGIGASTCYASVVFSYFCYLPSTEFLRPVVPIHSACT